jgi:hypothetical protein
MILWPFPLRLPIGCSSEHLRLRDQGFGFFNEHPSLEPDYLLATFAGHLVIRRVKFSAIFIPFILTERPLNDNEFWVFGGQSISWKSSESSPRSILSALGVCRSRVTTTKK